MTNVTTLTSRTRLGSGDLSGQISAVLKTMDSLLHSPDAAVVFENVARLCVPLLADVAIATITEDGPRRHAVRWPLAAPHDAMSLESTLADEADCYRVLVPIRSRAREEADQYSGRLELRCHGYEPSAGHEILAHLVAERATAVVDQERLAVRVRTAEERADNLAQAVVSNRDIGTAIGIVMAGRKVTSDAAFDLMRRVSQHTQRKVREIALDIIESGMIDISPVART